jgi:hypothetical protein
MRAALEVALFVAALALLLTVAKGLAPVFPALAGVLRALVNPIVLGLALAIFLLLRVARPARDRAS